MTQGKVKGRKTQTPLFKQPFWGLKKKSTIFNTFTHWYGLYFLKERGAGGWGTPQANSGYL